MERQQQAKLIIKRLPDQFGDVETKTFASAPPKSECSSAKNLVGYGTVEGFAVFRDIRTLDFVLMSMSVESTVEGGQEILEAQIKHAEAQGKKNVKKQLVEMGLATYKFPELKKSGYYVLQRGTHTWQKKKFEKKVEEPEPTSEPTETQQEDQDQDQSHF